MFSNDEGQDLKEPRDTENDSLLKPKSYFKPPRNRNSCLDKTIDYVKQQKFVHKIKNESNISKDQWKGICTLKNNDKIVIQEADKGGCVVIMNKEHYKEMILTHLNDTATYKKTDSNCDKKVRLRLEKLAKKHQDMLTKEETAFIVNFTFRTSNFYGLPKVHKSKLIKEAIESRNSEYVELLAPQDLTLRPIVGGPVCPTRPLSNLLDILLKPFIVHVNSYIKDNLDFLSKCSRDNKETSVLVTFDVKSLYTSIPHEYGIEALTYWVDNFPNDLHRRFSKEFVVESARFILENNNFIFDDEFYTQISGTAMGTIFAPTYATLTMGYLELKLYDVCLRSFGPTVKKLVYENWSRFLDDCEILLDKTLITPEQLLEILNSLHNEIQFTMEYSDTEIPFLDILIKRGKNGIILDLYRKPTDTQRCLNFSSCHPSHCKRNIPFCMARRICTIVENSDRKAQHLENLKENLKKYDYPDRIIEIGINKAAAIPQDELRKPKVCENKKAVAFVSTYNPNNPKVFHLIKSAVNTLKDNKVKGFQNLELIHARRQAPNLKRILTTSDFKSKDPEVGVFKCGDPRCECCEALLLGKSYTFKNVKKEFKLKTRMTCSSSNLIYVAICPTCGEEYIGETGINTTTLRDRARVYRQHIREPSLQKLKVEGHFRACGKGKFKMFPLLQLKKQDTELRRAKEQSFIKTYKSKLN